MKFRSAKLHTSVCSTSPLQVCIMPVRAVQASVYFRYCYS